MFNSKKLLVLALASALAACGGGGKDIGAGKGTGTGTGNTNTGGNIVDNTGGSDVSTNTDIKNPLLGSGVGSAFKKGILDIGIGSATLSAGGSTKISVSIVDGDSNNARIISQTFSVTFSSVCSEADPAKAVFNKNDVATSGGEATVTYKAAGCEGDDFITVKLRGAEGGKDLQTIIGKIKVAPADVGALSYVSTDSPALSLKGMANASLPSSTSVTFKLTDKNNNPIADRVVTFKLSNKGGGEVLALESDRTDTEGNVKAMVLSGTTQNIVSIAATATALDGSLITTSSQPISISTGLPRQDRMSISLKPFNPAAYDVDGVSVSVNVIVPDSFGNPVPDGTQVNFMAESGMIDSSCKTTKGECTVTWKSGGTRPGLYNGTLNRVNERVGFTSIMAYTEGEAGFTDSNGNNFLDANEPFLTFAEPFLDDDGDNAHHASEQFIDTDHSGNYTAAPTVYQGGQCSAAMKAAGHCARLVHARLTGRFVQSVANSVGMRFFNCPPVPTTTSPCTEFTAMTLVAPGKFKVVLQDANGNIPAAGTTLAVTGTGFEIFGDQGAVKQNSLGILNIPGLPTHGALFSVEYVAKGSAGADDKVELVATSGDQKVTQVFKP